MANLVATLHSTINRLLPFATPGTPLVQDILHLLALCGALYFAPQIQSYIQRTLRQNTNDQDQHATDEHNQEDVVPTGAAAQERGLEPAANLQQQQQDPAAHEHPPAQQQQGHNQAPIPPEQDNNDNDAAQPGPANNRPLPPRTINNNNIGAKKAKSLARRDQRRAYNEFVRSQGESQRAAEAADAQEREAELTAERARRAAAETEVRAREARTREERREKERIEREEEMGRRERAVGIVRAELGGARGICELEGVVERVGGGVDRAWVEKLVRASGMLGVGVEDGGEVTMLTERGWVVRVGRSDMEEMQRVALGPLMVLDEAGRVSYDQLGGVLENVLKSRMATAK